MVKIYIYSPPEHVISSLKMENIHFNRKTVLLLSCLRENARETLTDISKKTKIPISTLFDLLKELPGTLITKSTVLMDFPKLGYHTRAHLLLKVEQEHKEKLKQHLYFHSHVNSIYKINSGYDFMVETVHKNIKELDLFLEQLKQKFNISDPQIHYLIDEVKKEGFTLDPDDNL